MMMLGGSSGGLQAGSYTWVGAAGGLASEAVNWSPASVPGPLDTVVFGPAGGQGIRFEADATHALVHVNQGLLVPSLSRMQWQVSDGWHVGHEPGQLAQAVLTDGVLVVTNHGGTAVLSVGNGGAGVLAIRGGRVVADRFVATNGVDSVVSFAGGELTTLHGMVLSNASSTVLADTRGAEFVWNVGGGRNEILSRGPLTGRGTLGLGKDSIGSQPLGRATVNLRGAGTVLKTAYLDVAGGQQVRVTGGAMLQTYATQWGVGGVQASNSVMIIDGPGSSWVNDTYLYFGMHGGSQTLIITNQGYVLTGNARFRDLTLGAFDDTGTRMIVTGTNSHLHSDGLTKFGHSWKLGRTPVDNLLLVTNGGRVSVRELIYGTMKEFLGGPSVPGNVVEVADGSLSIQELDWSVGTIRIGSGTGVIDTLMMHGGTNAILEVRGRLLVGARGHLQPGDLRLGSTNTVVADLAGDLSLGGWEIGQLPGDSGTLTMVGGRAAVTNLSGNATLGVGMAGAGTLHVLSGALRTDLTVISAQDGSFGSLNLDGPDARLETGSIFVGAGGAVVVTNGAVLLAGQGELQGALDVRSGLAIVGPPGAGMAAPGTVRVASGGVLVARGRIAGEVVIEAGSTLSVSGEALSIEGSLNQRAGGTILIPVAGGSAGSGYPQVHVAGKATLAGRMLLRFARGFAPRTGERFEVLRFETAPAQVPLLEVSGLAPGHDLRLGLTPAGSVEVTSFNDAISDSLPVLSILKSADGVTISWPEIASDFILQSAASVPAVTWTDETTNSGPVVLPFTADQRVFRLIQR